MKSLYIKDLQKNLLFTDETFLIISAEKAQGKNGMDYYKLTLSDKTGRVDGKIWSDALGYIDQKLLKEGRVLAFSGKVDEYKKVLQVTITGAQQVDESKLDDFLESSEYDADEMMAELISEVGSIKDRKLKEVMLTMLNAPEIQPRLKFWPAGNSVHHGFRSGMLQHILEMITVSKGMKRFYPNLNYDVLLAGIILHDLGKIEELGTSPVGQSSYSKKGGLIGHIVLGMMMFSKYAEGKINEDTYIHICHLILSHHGSKEFGSPVTPSTPEAFVLTYLDNISSKTKTATTALKNLPAGEEFTDFNRWLGGVKIWNGGNGDVENPHAESSNTASDDDAIDQMSLV